MLHLEVDGAGGGRVVLVHGFTQTARSWDSVAPALAAHREVVGVDLPGHGGSSDVRLGFAQTAAAIGGAGGRAVYVGYSLGGRLCLRLALDRPDLVAALLLVGASPGLAEPTERAARRRADDALAAEIEHVGTTAFVDRWLASPLFAGLRPSRADLEGRRANRPDGLAWALRVLGTGSQEPLWDRLGALHMPVLVTAGADDLKFAALAAAMAADIPSAMVALVPDAGHAAHLERPDEWLGLVQPFLDTHHTA
ncbi:MAG: alpha/beta fold hydrolase [Acidimicrobiales bacterium]